MGLSAKGACTKAPVCSHTGTVEQEMALKGHPVAQLSATWPLAGPNEYSQAICPTPHRPMLITADRPLRLCRNCQEDKRMSTENLQFLSVFDKRLHFRCQMLKAVPGERGLCSSIKASLSTINVVNS